MKKIAAKEFMAVMTVANRRHQDAVRDYLRIQKDGDLFKVAPAEQKIKELHDEIVWLVGGLLRPGSGTYARLARMTATELLKKPKASRGRKG